LLSQLESSETSFSLWLFEMSRRRYCSWCFPLLVLATVVFTLARAPGEANEIRKIQWFPQQDALRFEVTLAELAGLSVADTPAPDGSIRLEIANITQPFKNQSLLIRDDRIRKCSLAFDEKRHILSFTFSPAAGVTARHRTDSAPAARIVLLFSAPPTSAKQPDQLVNPSTARLLTPDRGPSGEKRIVIIDPGHGGSSLGAFTLKKIAGRQILEKIVVLDIAEALKALINDTPDMTAYLTRETDCDVSLRARGEFAERYNGDLFISIHCNSTPRNRPSPARGIEFYYWNEKGSDDAAVRWLEEQENIDEIESVINNHSTLRPLLKNLLKDQLEVEASQSAQFCAQLQKSFQQSPYFAKYCRGIKSARFKVLENYSMPSVLVEVGFLSNSEEAKMLANPQFQRLVAALLLHAIKAHFQTEGGMGD
jgi:N-acetylmuramoyl-L-alanine amidase